MNDTRTSVKVVLLGDSGVGKTSILNQWTTEQFESSMKPTVGAKHMRRTVWNDGEEIDLYVWDTAGQEQYQALAPLYTRAAACAIIVASLDDITSFSHIPIWIQLVRDSCEVVPPIILSVNKIDLPKQTRVMTIEDAEKKYESIFDGVFFTSAVTGDSVQELFKQALKSGHKYYKSQLKLQNVETTTNIDSVPKEKSRCC